MKNYLRLVLVGLIFCAAGNAQLPVKSEPNWAVLEPEGESFSVELPSIVSSDRSRDKSENKFWTSINGDYFMIFSEKLEKLQDVRIALEYVRSHETHGEKQKVGLIEMEQFEFKDEDSFYHSIVSFNLGQRAYLFHGITRTKDDALVKRFLSSLKVNGLQARQIEESEKSVDLPLTPDPRQAQAGVSGYGSGSGRGSGSGYGNGNGSGNGASADNLPKVLPDTVPVKLLSKPRASYTDLARIYQIQGTARLKVTLLSTGEVGSISPVTYLPFGLMTSAVQAARSIKFEPRRVNGVPMNSIVTMEYSFTIY